MADWQTATPVPDDTGVGGARAVVLRPAELARHADRSEHPAPGELDRWIEKFWSVRWRLGPDQRFVSSVVPDPSTNLTLERGDHERDGVVAPGAYLTGVVSGRRFDVTLRGTGAVVGVKLRPGALTALSGLPGWQMVDRVLPAAGRLPGAEELDRLDPFDPDWDTRLADILLARLPMDRVDPSYDRLATLLARLASDASIVRGTDLAASAGMSVRSVQRLFRAYVGVGPKWFVVQARVADAVRALDAGYAGPLTDLAAAGGWFDQAHFIDDFQRVVGSTPGLYRRTANPAE